MKVAKPITQPAPHGQLGPCIADLEREINGLVTYDHQVEKMDIPRIREINRAVIEGDGK